MFKDELENQLHKLEKIQDDRELNKNTEKIVTTPKKWVLDNTDRNLITLNEWIKI